MNDDYKHKPDRRLHAKRTITRPAAELTEDDENRTLVEAILDSLGIPKPQEIPFEEMRSLVCASPESDFVMEVIRRDGSERAHVEFKLCQYLQLAMETEGMDEECARGALVVMFFRDHAKMVMQLLFGPPGAILAEGLEERADRMMARLVERFQVKED